MTPAEILALLYPWYLDPSDPRHVPEPDRARVIALAAVQRPLCLTLPQQDLAQAFYAAHLLSGLQPAAQAAADGGPVAQTSGVLVREREGDVERQYALPSQVGGQLVSTASGQSPYAAWKALADLCRVVGKDGTVLPGVGGAAIRRGAMITRYG